MSRCFPFQPTGYSVIRNASKEALIDSIKLQKPKVNAQEQNQDKKREKKEKRKVRKEKRVKETFNLDKPHVHGHFAEKLKTKSVAGFFDTGNRTESEQLERSTLTEENEKPVCLRVPSTSADSTENSNKRKRHSLPDVTGGHGGNIIRIRLPLKKQKHSDALLSEPQPCSTSGRAHFPSQMRCDFADRLGSECCTSTTQVPGRHVDRSLVLKISRHCSASKQTVNPLVPVQTDAVMTLMEKEELLYKNLTENFVLPQLQNGCLSLVDNNDWLSPSKYEKKSCRSERISSCSTSATSLWPVATHLPEVDVFAMPFTVPF